MQNSWVKTVQTKKYGQVVLMAILNDQSSPTVRVAFKATSGAVVRSCGYLNLFFRR